MKNMFKKVKVYKEINAVLNRITLKREFALIAKAEEMVRHDETNPDDSPDHLFLLDKSGAKDLLYVGDKVYSRECFDKEACLSKILKKYPDIRKEDVSFPTINALFRIAADRILEIPFNDYRREIINRKWINEYLQIGTNEGERYMNDDFSAINIHLQKIGEKKDDFIPAKTERVADPAKFEIYDRLMKMLYDSGKEYHYGDDFCIEYSIIYAHQEYRYYLMYFFSNHNWDADPANILNVCITATIVPGIFDRKDVRFTHPSKKTYCKENGEKYLMSFMTMDNDVSVKFLYNGDVAGNRVYDNLIDFFVWLSSFHLEIYMI